MIKLFISHFVIGYKRRSSWSTYRFIYQVSKNQNQTIENRQFRFVRSSLLIFSYLLISVKNIYIFLCKGHDLGWTSWELYNFILIGLTNELVDLGATSNIKSTVLQLWATYLGKVEVAFTSTCQKEAPRLAKRYNQRYSNKSQNF